MVVDPPPALRFKVEWEDPQGVSTPELAATWARLTTITAGRENITLVSDTRSSSTRTSIYAPVYSLAEWCAFNWWQARVSLPPRRQLTIRPFRRREPAEIWANRIVPHLRLRRPMRLEIPEINKHPCSQRASAT